MALIIVVGMKSEARLAEPLGRVLIGASALARALREGAAGVLSFGLCGGLDPALAPGDLLLGSSVLAGDRRLSCNPAWLAQLSAAFPSATVGAIAGSDMIVASSIAKANLHALTGAVATDMESHRVALAASEAGVPFAVLRAVSDGAADSLPLSAQAGFQPDGTTDIGAVIRGLIARPGDLPGLIRTARNAGAAFGTLAVSARLLRSRTS